MRSRAVRVTLLLLAVAAIGTAAYFAWTVDRRSAASTANQNTVEWKLEAVARQTIELRAAQRAYVAAGQSEQFWITRVSELSTQLEDAIAAYRGAFVDGFYLNGDPEFDFWVTSARARFARRLSPSGSAGCSAGRPKR